MAVETTPEIYQIHVWVQQISPMIWRRILVRNDSTFANLHDVLQIAFGWRDLHLHKFRIHGRNYGVNRVGGLWFSRDARTVPLADFQFRSNERFLYEYDFGDGWQHVVRVERRLTMEPRRTYPVCVGGQRAAPRRTVEAPGRSWNAAMRSRGRSASTGSGSSRVSMPAIATSSEMSWRQSIPYARGSRSIALIAARSLPSQAVCRGR